MAKLLSGKSGITELNLSINDDNIIGNNEIGNEGALELSKVLEVNTVLLKLSLGINKMKNRQKQDWR